MALTPACRQWLAHHFGAGVKFAEPMARHTSLKVGGPADAYVVPENLEMLKILVAWCAENSIPCLVVGDGTNLLVKDNGIQGVVVVLTRCLQEISSAADGPAHVQVVAMAGVRMKTLCRFAVDNGLAGLNFATGIPGTVGGAIAVNAGTASRGMGDVVAAITVLLPSGQTVSVPKERLNFSYRRLEWNLAPHGHEQAASVIIDGRFRLERADTAQLRAEAEQLLKTRRQKQPWNLASAGCFFKNPAPGRSAGELIDMVGLKGRCVGGAQVSTQHANFLVNTGNATAADFIALMEQVQAAVAQRFDIELEREVKIVGT